MLQLKAIKLKLSCDVNFNATTLHNIISGGYAVQYMNSCLKPGDDGH